VSKVPLWLIINAILYKLKTGVQWRYLPVKELFVDMDYTYNGVYHHYQKWSKDGTWEKVWHQLLDKHRKKLDMSSVQLDGSHTPVKRGGIEVGYQNRKKCKTSNILFLVDSKGSPLACSNVIAGHHNDAFELEKYVDEMLAGLTKSNLSYDSIFLNADAGFDAESFRQYCLAKDIIANIDYNTRNNKDFEQKYIFDEELYKDRYAIERTNAWIDGFKALLIRFETNDKHWRAWHFIAFTVILLRNLKV
jgi:transposase